MKTNNTEMIKSILASKLNQVYFEMYLEKIAKELKNVMVNAEYERGTTAGDRRNRLNATNKRYIKGKTLFYFSFWEHNFHHPEEIFKRVAHGRT